MEFKLKYTEEEGKHIFFTSDSHYGHSNIIWMCKRPYTNVEEMNRKLIENWNNVVKPDDLVFHLGDFAFGGQPLWRSIREQLNGNIILIKGNHDDRNLKNGCKVLFDGVYDQVKFYIENRCIYLNHYPFLCYGGSYRSEEDTVFQLFGHVHSGPNSTGLDNDRLKMLFPYQYDVGVDNNNYTPVSWEQIKEIIHEQTTESK